MGASTGMFFFQYKKGSISIQDIIMCCKCPGARHRTAHSTLSRRVLRTSGARAERRIIEAARPCTRHGRVLALARGIPAYTGPAGDASDRKAWATAARSRLLRTSALLTHARRGPRLLFEHASHAAAHGTDMRKGTHMQCTAGGRGPQHEPTPLPPGAPSPHNALMTARGAAGGTVCDS